MDRGELCLAFRRIKLTFVGAICNGKGGVGKTFVSVNISAALAAWEKMFA